jgi:hypothetical protein
MSTSGATSLGSTGRGRTDSHDRKRGFTPAQWFCLLAGATLLLVGLLGFIADASFDTAGSSDGDARGNADGQLQGDGFLGFEVNGWHNLVHIASGLLLLSAFRKAKTAKTIALVFGVLYAIVTIIGLIDGNDILGFMPINPADNILHLLLSAAAILAALASRGHDHDHDHVDHGRVHRAETTTPARGTVTDRRVVAGDRDGDRIAERIEPRDLNRADRR